MTPASVVVDKLLESREDEFKDMALSVPLQSFPVVLGLVRGWPEFHSFKNGQAIFFEQHFPPNGDLFDVTWDGDLTWGGTRKRRKIPRFETMVFTRGRPETKLLTDRVTEDFKAKMRQAGIYFEE